MLNYSSDHSLAAVFPNLSKCKAVRFTRAEVKIPLGYSICGQKKFQKQAIVNTWE